MILTNFVLCRKRRFQHIWQQITETPSVGKPPASFSLNRAIAVRRDGRLALVAEAAVVLLSFFIVPTFTGDLVGAQSHCVPGRVVELQHSALNNNLSPSGLRWVQE